MGMSFFDYDILNGKCSKYETSHLHIYVDDNIDLENLDNMTLSAYATFVHEYIHYIQHITSLYGIRMSDMYNRMGSVSLSVSEASSLKPVDLR